MFFVFMGRISLTCRNLLFILQYKLNCWYAPILRLPGNDHDITLGAWQPIKDEVRVTQHEFIFAQCSDKGSDEIVYR